MPELETKASDSPMQNGIRRRPAFRTEGTTCLWRAEVVLVHMICMVVVEGRGVVGGAC